MFENVLAELEITDSFDVIKKSPAGKALLSALFDVDAAASEVRRLAGRVARAAAHVESGVGANPMHNVAGAAESSELTYDLPRLTEASVKLQGLQRLVATLAEVYKAQA